MQEILKLERVSKAFGSVRVADQLSFSVNDGEALGIIGPNGAGKTSMFNLVTGAISADDGQIIFRDCDVSRSTPNHRCKSGIARTHQVPRPFDEMTVFENVLVGATFGGGKRGKAANDAALDALDESGLLEKANRLAGSLPLLDRKRLELARALATSPKLLLLDEIAGGLTEHEVHELIEMILRFRARGLSIIWIEHIVHALIAVVDRLIVLNQGKVLLQGVPKEVMESETVREIYLGGDFE